MRNTKEAITITIPVAVMVPHPPIIIPEIGKGEELKVNSTILAMTKAMMLIAEAQPDTVVIISSHNTMYTDYFHISPGENAYGDFEKFGVKEVSFNVNYDSDFTSNLTKIAKEENLEAGTEGEIDKRLDHGTMVPLYFLRRAYYGKLPCKIVRVGLSGMPFVEHYRLGTLIKKTAEKLKKTVCVIGSGDLSHVLKKDGPYGYKPEGPIYDSRIMDVMERAAFGELLRFSEDFNRRAAECGHRSFTIMAGCLDGRSVDARKLSYEGPFGVGYGVCTYLVKGPDLCRRFIAVD